MAQMAQYGLVGSDPTVARQEFLDNQDATELLLGLGKDSKAQILSMAEDEDDRRWNDNLSMV